MTKGKHVIYSTHPTYKSPEHEEEARQHPGLNSCQSWRQAAEVISVYWASASPLLPANTINGEKIIRENWLFCLVIYSAATLKIASVVCFVVNCRWQIKLLENCPKIVGKYEAINIVLKELLQSEIIYPLQFFFLLQFYNAIVNS